MANVLLLGPESLEAVSIRPGRGHRGITLLATPPTDRRQKELDIICTLAGDLSAMQFRLLEDGYHEPPPDEVAAVAATASLDELAPLTRERLLEAEDDEAPVGDELAAERAATSLADWSTGSEAFLHVAYLRAVATGFVERHTWAIRRVAEALLEHETLDGATAAETVTSTRCVCHWQPKRKEDEPMSKSTPEPAPILSSDGIPIVMPKPLTLDHPHCMVAARGFWLSFVEWPTGATSPGRTWVKAGQLLDDRSALVRHAPKGSLRKPTEADRQAATAA